MNLLPRILAVSISATLLASAAHADVRLPAMISDHMVLQQEMPANVWGWAAPGEKIAVKFGGKSVETVADGDGKWSAKLDDLKAGTAGELTIEGKNALTVKDVIVGEVWLASGQSNMEWIVANSKDAPQETAAANLPAIRIFTVSKNAQAEPQEDLPHDRPVVVAENEDAVARRVAVVAGVDAGRAVRRHLSPPPEQTVEKVGDFRRHRSG